MEVKPTRSELIKLKNKISVLRKQRTCTKIKDFWHPEKQCFSWKTSEFRYAQSHKGNLKWK
jgi:hypothetical protein